MNIDILKILEFIGGLSLFLFGMDAMGKALERRAGSKLRGILGKLTTNRFAGLLTGMGVTAVIQSSSATTVMVVGFVNSGIMSLKQAINVIMGANIGTTITAWILSLSGIDGGNLFMKLLKPTSFSPILAFIGIIYLMFCKSSKKHDTGTILLGFATLMFGMDTMAGAVKCLEDVPAFQEMFIMFENPILGMLAGAVLTGIIQSSSASVGILQTLASTGKVSYGAAIPIIMGQNIGTCITALISSIGANKNAKRAAAVHLSFNVIGTVVWLTVFSIVSAVVDPVLFGNSATEFGVAVAHSIFNIACVVLLFPAAGLLEKFVMKIVSDSDTPEVVAELDERLLATPPIALERCRTYANEMADCAVGCLKDSIRAIKEYSPKLAETIRENEEKTDHYEDVLGSYLVQLSTMQISEEDSREAAMILKAINDFERISDHSVNILESIEEIREKELELTSSAVEQLDVLTAAIDEILDLSLQAYKDYDLDIACKIEPLEQVIDEMKEKMRSQHIYRLQKGSCSIEAGFVWSDLLTNFERTSDHCSNIAGELIDRAHDTMNIHESIRKMKATDGQFKDLYEGYVEKYGSFI